ncbi:hypothetical protein MRX96_054389 [Rhipicephalus microplus]
MSAAEILVGAGGQSGDVAGEAGGEPCEPQAGGQGDRRWRRAGGPPRVRRCPIGLPRRRRSARACYLVAGVASEGERTISGWWRAAAGAAVAAFQAHGEATGFLLPYSPAVSGVRASVLVRLRRACSPLIAVCFARSLGGCAARRLLRFDDDRLSGGGESLLMLAPRGARRARGLAGTGRAFAAAVSLRPLPPLSARLSAGRVAACRQLFSPFVGRSRVGSL